MEGLPTGWIGVLTPGALLCLGFLLMMLGRVIPLKTHLRELEVRDKTIQYLQEALTISQENNKLQAEQLNEMMEHSRMTTAVIKSLPRRGAEETTTT